MNSAFALTRLQFVFMIKGVTSALRKRKINAKALTTHTEAQTPMNAKSVWQMNIAKN